MPPKISTEAKALTTVKIHLNSLCERIDKTLGDTAVDTNYLKLLSNQLDKNLDDFDRCQRALEEKTDEGNLSAIINEFYEFKNPKLELKAKINQYLDKNDLSSEISDRTEDIKLDTNTARLPKIELSRFKGDYREFAPFWDNFNALVHTQNISDVTKLTYLTGVLYGEALACIKGLPITDQSYDIAREILLDRYGSKERMIYLHVQKLIECKIAGHNVSELWSFYNTVQAEIRSLETLGINRDTYGVILTPLILTRLNNELRLEWSRKENASASNITSLLEFLFREIQNRERAQTFNKAVNTNVTDDKRKPKFQSSATSLTSVSGADAPRYCAFCPGATGHRSIDCRKIKGLKHNELTDKVRHERRCFRCLGNNHQALRCRSRNKCQICGDPGHHTILHNRDKNVYFNHDDNKTTVMQTLTTEIVDINGVKTTATILFDSGSDSSFVSGEFLNKCNLTKCGVTAMSLSGFGNRNTGPVKKRNVYETQLGKTPVKLIEVPQLCTDMFRAAVPSHLVEQFDVSFSEQYTTDSIVSVDILIGLDHYWSLVKNESIKRGCLVAQNTELGWMLSGYYNGLHENKNSIQLFCHQMLPVSDDLVSQLWKLDSVGITDSKGVDKDNSVVLQQFNDTIIREDDRYSVRLPWKPHCMNKLIDNRAMALSRLKSLSRKLKAQPLVKEQYDKNITDMEVSGIIKPVTEQMKKSHTGATFYLPHRPVVKNTSSTTKVRPVFDGSAKGYNGISLNDCLETGPNLLPSLIEILLRFRRKKIALTADIKQAFLQVKIQDSDRHVLRFLWETEEGVREMFFERVPFGTTSSPFLLNATIKYHLGMYENSSVKRELETNLYVDDFITCADTKEEITELISQSKSIMEEAGMKLTKWTSSADIFPEASQKEFDFKTESNSPTKVLGLSWSPQNDCFTFDCGSILTDVFASKRNLLSIMARIFDPLGFFSPFTITAKIMFQELWKLGISWDEEVPSQIKIRFGHWLEDLKHLKMWKIPRSFVKHSWDSAKDTELHVFCDSSEKAYGACVYIKITERDDIKTSLVMSKARVAPVKKVTLPRLELLAAVLGCRILRFTLRALELPSNTRYACYSDSQIALAWIKSDTHKLKTFVANRVQEIQEKASPNNWHYCPGHENPADLLTRGIPAKTLYSSKQWLEGPVWLLYGGGNCRVPSPVSNRIKQEIEREERGKVCLANLITIDLTSFCKFSSLTKTINVVAFVIRFISKCKKRVTENKLELSLEEKQTAHTKLLKLTQLESYAEEIERLTSGQIIPKTSSIYKLNPFMGEDDLLRTNSRLDYSTEFSYDEKFPIILPKNHFSFLLTKQKHIDLKHAGVNQLITAVRHQYWIIGLRSLAKRVKRQCLSCQILEARSCKENTAPIMANRLTPNPPFAVIGIDYAGPIYCRDTMNKKFYILLITCASIRAIHLELVESLNLSDFLLAFRRFVARRGLPTIIHSDNAKTFVYAPKGLEKIYGIHIPKWRFNCPRSPWWGGWFERMVKTIKTSLRRTLGTASIDRNLMEVILLEIEACVNSRPLTFVGDDIEDSFPITPSQILLGRSAYLNPTSAVLPQSDQETITRSHEDRIAYIEIFWQRWRNEYLKQLPIQPLQKKFGCLKMGDVVLIREDNTPRLQWPLGVVTEMTSGKDGICRRIRLKTKSGEIWRPIQRLHNLELNQCVTKSGRPLLNNNA